MLKYEKIDASEGIDVNKTSKSEKCELCHYCFFKDVGFKFGKHFCNKCLSWFINDGSFFKKYSDIEHKRKYF